MTFVVWAVAVRLAALDVYAGEQLNVDIVLGDHTDGGLWYVDGAVVPQAARRVYAVDHDDGQVGVLLQDIQESRGEAGEVLGRRSDAGRYAQRLDQFPHRVVALVVEVVEGAGPPPVLGVEAGGHELLRGPRGEPPRIEAPVLDVPADPLQALVVGQLPSRPRR